ncbi:hydroxyacylglutathione hydrolase [Roseomonas sp. BN140053]|uniref:hydroxyacylglutathione hydrolase n=1 Tax=Roseomonas sp. BN140053 TaxID=3391898 RepID=UPI0039E7BF64
MTIKVQAVPCRQDNYAWLLVDTDTGTVALCDPGEAAPALAALQALPEPGRCDFVLLTHHHADHVEGVAAVVAATGAKVVGAAADAHRLPPLDHALAPGDGLALGKARAVVIDTPGHTRGHIAFHVQAPAAEPDALLCGDTLFSLGCGKLLEGTAEEMFLSLQRLRVLPPDTLVCCGHEYTESNARFALTVEPDNEALRARAAAVRALRADGKPTVPTTIAEELATNPFLRAPDVATLAARRLAKDSFR